MGERQKQAQINSKFPAFTIIEVVLVLAIAGLIFLMVFIALPALQRNQRDTQRKNDLNRMLTAANSYMANNKGQALAWTDAADRDAFIDNYLKVGGDSFTDPSGTDYILTIGSILATFDGGSPIIQMGRSSTCGQDGALIRDQPSNRYAFRMRLEGGGIYCLNN